jgi:hypothetical protein
VAVSWFANRRQSGSSGNADFDLNFRCIALESVRFERKISDMASVQEFLRALDSIEAEIRQISDVVFLEMSLTRGEMTGDVTDVVDKTGRYITLLSSRSILAQWDELCFDIGGPEFPFVWSLKRSEVYGSFPKELACEREPVEFAVWYYLDSWKSPVPDHWLNKLPPDGENRHAEDGLAAMVYQDEINRAFNVVRCVKEAWCIAPESVTRKFGDLTLVPAARGAGGDDDFNLWWPAVLLFLALRKVDVVLSASAAKHIPFDSIFDNMPEGGDQQACIDVFEPSTWTVSLSPSSLMAATSCALRIFRRVAEDTMQNLDNEPKFEWRPPMLEGYVFALLKEVEYPTQRDAVAWIAKRSGKSAPSTSTLRKTFSWQIRPQKTPKSRTTNEAQSGVSPVLAADVRLSHEEVTNTVLDIQEEIHRQLSDDEWNAVEWTLQQAGVDEEERKKAIQQLVEGFQTAGM